MKKIKFRGKRVDNGKYVYGYYIEDKGLVKGPQIIPFYYHQNYGEIESYPVEPDSVQQFTGEIKDGEEVYE